jgi:hypothetical protein
MRAEHAADPRSPLTANERLQEIAALLVAGVRRLRTRQTGRIHVPDGAPEPASDSGPIGLEVGAETSPYGPVG